MSDSKHKNPFKMLYLSSDKYPPFRVDVAILFGKEITKRGHKIDWILQSEADLNHHAVQDWWGGRVVVGSTNNNNGFFGKVSKTLRDLRNDFRVFSQVKQDSYDFIQVKDKFIAALLAMYAAKHNNIKFIYWLSYPLAEAYLYRYHKGTARFPILNLVRGKFYKLLLYKYIMKKSDHVFVQSEQMKRDIIDQGINGDKLTAVPMGVEVASVPYEKNKTSTQVGDPMVVYLGTLTRVRRMDFLIRAFLVTKNRIPDAKLYLVGSGDYESDVQFLKKEVDKHGLSDSVIFTGFLPMEQAWEYVRKANVCVSPFYPTPILNSTSPTKLIEYMAMAKAVVANNHPEQSLVIRESGAGICVPYEEEAFGCAIANLLEDKKLALEMGEKGREYAIMNRSYEVLADKLEAKYQSLLLSNSVINATSSN